MTQIEITEFALPDHFKIPLPKGWQCDKTADNVLCRFFNRDRLGSSIFIEATKVSWSDSGNPKSLMEATKRFVNGPTVALDPSTVIDMETQTAIDSENNVAETVISMTDDNGWLIRIVHSVAKGILYCVYYNGPLDEIRELQPFFDLFEILPEKL